MLDLSLNLSWNYFKMVLKYFSPKLSSKDINNLKNHKYTSEGKSIAEPYFQIFWNAVINFVPMSIHPNLLTLLGLFFNIALIIPFLYVNCSLKDEISKYVLFFGIFCIFTYQTLDAIDGKQARRTNLCSSLGEIMDHGCDSISMVLLTVVVIGTISLGDYPLVSLLLFLLLNINFYTAHWQCFVSGKIIFGKIDVTETLLGLMSLMLTTALFGVGFWKLQILGISLSILPTLCTAGLSLKYFYSAMKSIFGGGVGPSGTTVAGTSVLSPGIPIILITLMTLKNADLFNLGSPSNIYTQYPALFLILHGFVIAKASMNLVIGQMSKSEVRLLDPTMLGPLCMLINEFIGCPINRTLLFVSALTAVVISTFAFFSQVISVFAEILQLDTIFFVRKNQ